MDEGQALEKLSRELRRMEDTLTLLLSNKKTCGYLTRVAKRIHKVFFIFYITVASLFLAFMFFNWNT